MIFAMLVFDDDINAYINYSTRRYITWFILNLFRVIPMATSNDQSNPRSAECSICFNLLQKPKLLSCHHTFCEGCLVTLYRSQGEQREVSCPLCRETTHVPHGKISRLGTNHALQSLVEEVASRVFYCTVCKSSEKPVGETYCLDCDDYMCRLM